MDSKWFEFEDDFSSELDRFELLKKNLRMKNVESEKLKSWPSVNKVSDALDLETDRTGIFIDRNKLWDSVIRNRLIGRSVTRRQTEDCLPVSDNECDDILSDITDKSRRIKNRFSQERFESEFENRRKMKFQMGNSSSYGNECFRSGKKTPEDRTWSRKSSCHGNVTFPESSNASVASETASDKSYGRSVSINSEDSVCTEKSADCSTISEKLPDGTNKTHFENCETWLTKSMSGSTICEKKIRDSNVTEKKEDRVSDKTTKRISYLERSATGSSLQEESTTEKTVSSDKNSVKTVEEKTSLETYKKAFRNQRPSSSSFYDVLDSCSFRQHLEERPDRKKDFGSESVTEKISKLIDEAVHQDSLFKIPTKLETDIDRMTSDFADLRGTFGRERRKQTRRRSSGFSSETGKTDQDLNWSKFNELKAENESLLQENSKLQSIIRDVTAVNKRWQKYNNERRLYVQKLLSTIQDLQEQINLISEKSAFQSGSQEELNLVYQDVEKLKREYQEHVTVLELQIKSHKDDWDAERKEKQKVVHEKQDLERRLQDVMSEIKFLKNVLLEERKRKFPICSSCRSTFDEGAVFPRAEYFPNAQKTNMTNPFVPKTFRTAVHVPYNMNDLSSEECLYSKKYMSKDEQGSQEFFSSFGDSYLNERFSEYSDFPQSENTSGDTIVVEGKNGLRLSITEQFPSKDNLQLKSILKKNDKKLKVMSKNFSEVTESGTEGKCRNRKISADGRSVTSEECESTSGCGISIGFEKDGLAEITSFSTYSEDQNCFELGLEKNFLKVDNRSKSEPNTRSNSSEDLKPLRESSSWNNQCGAEENMDNAVCMACKRSFSSSMNSQYLNHVETCPREPNHF